MFEKVKGQWGKEMFFNSNPIVLEIGCGRGEYSVGLGELFPDKNFIGVDIKGSRIYKGAKYVVDNNRLNVAFLRTQALLLDRFFEDNEVDEIWLTFPDPRPLDGDEKRRLFSPRFLNIYKSFLRKNAIINLKTDNYELYKYALDLCISLKIEIKIATEDIYNSEFEKECFSIQTTYEKRYLDEGTKINFLKVCL